MAIVRVGPLVGGISGAVGSTVFANSRAGLIVRPRGHRSGGESVIALRARGMFSRVVAAWKALTAAQRAAWSTVAAVKPLPNRLGVVRPLTGWQLYSMFAMDVYLGSPPAALAPPAQSLIYAPSFVAANFLEGGPYCITSRGLPWPTSTPTEFGYVQRGRRATQTSGFRRGLRIGSWSHPLGTKDAYAVSAAAGVELFTGQPFAAGVSWQVGGGYMGLLSMAAGTIGDVPWISENFESNSLAPYSGDLTSFSVAAGAAKSGTYGLQASFTNAGSVARAIRSTSGLSLYPVRGHVFECWVQMVNATTERWYVFFGVQDASNLYRFVITSAGNGGIQKLVANVGTNICIGAVTGFVSGAWYRMVVEWGYAGTMRARVYDAGGTSKLNVSGSDSTYNGGGVGFGATNVAGSAALVYYDSLAVTGRSA